jgi:hypothetical protein
MQPCLDAAADISQNFFSSATLYLRNAVDIITMSCQLGGSCWAVRHGVTACMRLIAAARAVTTQSPLLPTAADACYKHQVNTPVTPCARAGSPGDSREGSGRSLGVEAERLQGRGAHGTASTASSCRGGWTGCCWAGRWECIAGWLPHPSGTDGCDCLNLPPAGHEQSDQQDR